MSIANDGQVLQEQLHDNGCLRIEKNLPWKSLLIAPSDFQMVKAVPVFILQNVDIYYNAEVGNLKSLTFSFLLFGTHEIHWSTIIIKTIVEVGLLLDVRYAICQHCRDVC